MRRVTAVFVALAAIIVGPVPAARAASQGCQAQYQVNAWAGGFTATVTVTAGSTPLNGWTVGWTYPGDQRITSAWNATVNQSTMDAQKCRPAAANGIPWWLVCANRLASVPCSAICRW